MPGRDLRVAAFERVPGGAYHGFRERDDVPPVGGHRRGVPAGRSPRPGHHAGQQLGLLREGGLEGGDLLVAGTPLHPGARRRGGVPVDVDQATFEDRQVREGAGGVPGHRREQTWEQRGAQVGAGLGERVGQPHHGPPRILGDQAHPVQVRFRDERQAEHLGEAGCGRGPHGGAAGTLGPRQSPARGRGREAAPDAVVADLAPDLLDDVVGVAQIGTPGRGLDGQGVAERSHPAAAGLEHAEDLLELHLGAQDRGDQSGSQVDPGRHRGLPDDRDVAADLAAAVFHEQAGGAAGGGVGEPRVDGAFETFGGLRRQPVPPEGVGDAGRGECRGLQHDGRGLGGDLGGFPAHDAGDPDRTGVVGDQQVIGRERAADAVEGGDLLPLGGEPHPDRSLQFGRVVGVQWLPGLEHHVVGDVHGKGD